MLNANETHLFFGAGICSVKQILLSEAVFNEKENENDADGTANG